MAVNQQLLKILSENLTCIAEKATAPTDEDGLNFIMHDEVMYCLPTEEFINFNEIINTILKQNNNSKKFSSKFIGKKVKKIFADILKAKENGDKHDTEGNLFNLFEELSNYSRKSTTYLKVDGIAARCEFKIGNATFFPGDKEQVDKIYINACDVLKTTLTSSEDRVHYAQLISKVTQEELLGGCVVAVEVDAEPIRAFEIAKQEANRALDLLRLVSATLHPILEDIRIGLKGDHPRAQRTGFIFSEGSFQSESDSIGSVRPLELNRQTIEHMNTIGASKISEALQKSQANNLEEKLIQSIHWFSSAKMQDENENKLLCLIIALEALFKAEPGNSIGGTVAESVALITSDKIEHRRQTIKIVRDGYSKRSGVAHGGQKTISDGDIATLTIVTIDTILETIRKLNDFSSQKELMSWIEELKLS
ncbi:HEPN domain-containing protein [Pseudomonas sp. 30_B]|uniref:HEPN domain-containing protein n=1 Tax=Pseudomonas sp. 30_B TaxID=2813575 RepID=UPI001A9FD0B3|nr:HEPN domain-containing protein [Pseudomonas sp. 30_B]